MNSTKQLSQVGILLLNLRDEGDGYAVPGAGYVAPSRQRALAKKVSVEMKKFLSAERLKKIAAVLALGFLIASPARAAVQDSDAIRTIVGEAANQGPLGMTAVAAAIRNRGTLRGAYGFSARHSDSEPRYVWTQAAHAWSEAKAGVDPTRGATHWFSRADMKKLSARQPAWFRRLRFTAKIGDQFFYREARA